MSHGDRVEALPPGFASLAASGSCPIAALGDRERRIYGLQFHPEVHHTPSGLEMLQHFVVEICGAPTGWTPQSIIQSAVKSIRQQVGKQNVLVAVSGGVDSSVAAALVHKALGAQLSAVFVDNGLLRQGERDQVEMALRSQLGPDLHIVNASQTFLSALHNINDPERKRRIIGETFIRVFETQAKKLGKARFLVQGTIYPDVVESRAPERAQAQRIKTHHNVGGLPEHMDFELVEPLRYLFKDEVRAVGETLGLSEELVWRQPFPGPGLAVRCLGNITVQRLTKLRAADYHNGQESIAQAFAVLLPVRSVGVMGDQRTYQEVIALRAVTSQDFMTADWARLPQELLARAANRIVNEIAGINRVVYDITSKPPATIEWE
jgi:GMP synthase (glutamine-hydrolysing)